MKTLAIIGTAGRGADKYRLNAGTFGLMVRAAVKVMELSGGTADTVRKMLAKGKVGYHLDLNSEKLFANALVG